MLVNINEATYNTLNNMSNAVGLSGVTIILIAYFLLNAGRWQASSVFYQLINFVGAWLILFSLYFHWNLSSVMIEISWIMISVMGMYRTLSKTIVFNKIKKIKS